MQFNPLSFLLSRTSIFHRKNIIFITAKAQNKLENHPCCPPFDFLAYLASFAFKFFNHKYNETSFIACYSFNLLL